MIRLDNWRVRMEVRDRELGYESDHLHRGWRSPRTWTRGGRSSWIWPWGK